MLGAIVPPSWLRRTGWRLAALTIGALPWSQAMIELKIPDMTCGHCVAVVTKTIQQADPAARVDIDLPSHQVRVQTALDRATLVAALAEEGYAPA
jgi:copper chaperone